MIAGGIKFNQFPAIKFGDDPPLNNIFYIFYYQYKIINYLSSSSCSWNGKHLSATFLKSTNPFTETPWLRNLRTSSCIATPNFNILRSSNSVFRLSGSSLLVWFNWYKIQSLPDEIWISATPLFLFEFHSQSSPTKLTEFFIRLSITSLHSNSLLTT